MAITRQTNYGGRGKGAPKPPSPPRLPCAKRFANVVRSSPRQLVSQIKSIFPSITTQAPSGGVARTRQLTKLKAQASWELHARCFSVSSTDARTAQNPQRRHRDTRPDASCAGQQERCLAPPHWYGPTLRPRADGTFHRTHPFSVHLLGPAPLEAPPLLGSPPAQLVHSSSSSTRSVVMSLTPCSPYSYHTRNGLVFAQLVGLLSIYHGSVGTFLPH